MQTGFVNQPIDLTLTAARSYKDIFNEIEVDVVFRDQAGEIWRVPAFWAGENVFRVRFAAPRSGRYAWRSECSEPGDSGLHGRTGELEAQPYEGVSALYRHGRLRVDGSHRNFEHADGTPFLWLADTWWMGLTKRLDWPEGFQGLVADRVRKGFNTVQIVAGPLPDFCATTATWDPQQANEAGWPWEKDFARINPAFYDLADQRLTYMIEQGLMPCIVAMWGYYLPFMGVDRCKQHWRYLVARYGAYPVTWCLCGECTMQTYSQHGPEQDEMAELQQDGWTEVARYLRGIDPYHNLLAVHPSCNTLGRQSLTDESLSDFDMLHTGHGGYYSLVGSVAAVQAATRRQPRMPVLNSEVNYEGIMGGSKDEIQRFLFWANMLQGACGHTYGAQGIWAMSSRHEPFKGTTGSWGDGVWQDVMHYPGSAQLGLGAQILRRLPWWRMEPDYASGIRFVARVPGETIFAYVPCRCLPPELAGSPFPLRIEAGARYRANYVSPRDGTVIPVGEAVADKGQWMPPRVPGMDDWLLILEIIR